VAFGFRPVNGRPGGDLHPAMCTPSQAHDCGSLLLLLCRDSQAAQTSERWVECKLLIGLRARPWRHGLTPTARTARRCADYLQVVRLKAEAFNRGP